MGSNQSRCTPCNNQPQQRSQPQPINCSPRVSTTPLYNQYNSSRPLSNCQNIGQIGQSVPLAYKVAPVHYQPSRQMSYQTHQTRQPTQQNCSQQQQCRYQTNMQPPINMQPRKPPTCCYTPPPQHHQRPQPRPYSCISPVTNCSPQPPPQPPQPSVNYSRQSIAFPQQFYYNSCTPPPHPPHPSSYGYYNNNCTFSNSFGGCNGYPISSY